MENEQVIVPKKSLFKRFLKLILWLLFIFLFLLGTAITLVFVYEDDVKGIVIKELNKNLQTEVRIDPKNIDLTFISSFPNCAIEFKNLTAMETWTKKDKDTLIFAESLSLQFNIKDIFSKKYHIKKIKLKNADVFLKVDKKGVLNYEVWKTTSVVNDQNKNDSLNFKLEAIILQNIKLSYRDKKINTTTKLQINDLLFSGNFSERSYEMISEGEIFINTLSIEKINYLKNKTLKLNVAFNVKDNHYLIEKSELALNQMLFNLTGDFTYTKNLNKLNLDYKAKNLDIESILSLLPDKYKSRINDYKSTGDFFASGNLNYNEGTPLSLHSNFGIKNASIEYTIKSSKLNNVSVNGQLTMNKESSILELKNISASLNEDHFSGQFLMTNFNDPFIDLKANGTFNLAQVTSFWPIDTVEKLEGTLKFNGEVKGLVSDLKQHTFSDKVNVNILAEVMALKAKFKKDSKELAVENCKIKAVGRDVRVENLLLIKGSSDVDLTGEIPGIFNYILDRTSPLVIKGTLKSKSLNIEDFIYPGGSESETELSIPANVNLQLDAEIQHFIFNKFTADNISGNFELKNQKVLISDMTFQAMQGTAEVNAFADASGKNLEVTLQSKLKNINIEKMFSQLNNFGQSTMTNKNVNGFVTASIDFSGNWDKKLNSELNSIKSTADLTIENGELNDFKPLESLAKFVDLKELQRIKFSSLSSQIEIKNSTIYIPQTTIKNSALNIDFNGTHDFNNNIDYHIRLLISELLAKKRKQSSDDFGPVENDPENKRSAFILMTGNIDDIHVKYDRKGLKQKIKEDIKTEKQTIKQLLKEEFGAFKNDTINTKKTIKANQKFELEKTDNKSEKKTLEPKKKEEEDDDF